MGTERSAGKAAASFVRRRSIAIEVSRSELEALSDAERIQHRRRAEAPLRRADAHIVIDSVADLAPALDDISGRLARGERP